MKIQSIINAFKTVKDLLLKKRKSVFLFSDMLEVNADRLRDIINELERKIKNSPREICIVIDPKTGETVYKNTGSRYKVGLPIAKKHLMKNKILTHNHPNGHSGFSQADINTAFYLGLKEIRAVCKGHVHCLNLPSDFTVESIPKKVIHMTNTACADNIPYLKLNSKFANKLNSIYRNIYAEFIYLMKKINSTDKEFVASNIYRTCLLLATERLSKKFSRDKAITVMRKKGYWEGIYKQFTDLVPGSEYSIEKI